MSGTRGPVDSESAATPPHPPPRLSVITPCYNHAAYLRRTIDSVLSQEYQEVEHIVVDGGSTDGTVEILREYGERYPGRFRWISEHDDGQSDAINKGLRMAQGEIVGWQNSDDYYYPGAFAEPMAFLARHPEIAVVYGGCDLVDRDDRVTGYWPASPYNYARLLDYCLIPNQSTFIRRDALLAAGGVRTDLHYIMDHELWLRLGLRHRMAYLPGVRAAFRQLPDAKTHRALLPNRQEHIRVWEELIADPLLPLEMVEPARLALGRHLLKALLVAIALGDDACAAEVLTKARALDPELRQWPFYCGQVLMRRTMPEAWFGHIDMRAAAAVPVRTLALLERARLARSDLSRQVLAMEQLFRALDAASSGDGHAALAYAARSVQADPGWPRRIGAKTALLTLFSGRRMAYLLPAVSMVWSLRDRLDRVRGGAGPRG